MNAASYPLFHPSRENPRQLPLAMSTEEFLREFPSENDYVEWKRGTSREALQDAIVAFSNADGGVILIGVADDGSIVGRELTPGVADDIHTTIGVIHSPGRYSIHGIDVDGVGITLIAVARRIEGFAQTSAGRVMVRRGTLKVALIGAELVHFTNSRSRHRFEENSSGGRLEDAEPGLIADLAEAFGGWTNSVERLVGEGFALQGDDGVRLTVAGALYLLRDPAQVLGRSYIEVLRYQGDVGEYDRRVEIRGPLPVQVQRTVELVAEELGRELVVLGVRRHELARLPIVVLRETIANAVAHRSYELSGTPIRVELRPSAVTVSSPGVLPEPVTVENLRETHAARNLLTIVALRRFRLAEDAGRGIDVIIDSMREELLDPPSFRDTGHSVEVTLPIRSAVAPVERAWLREIEERGLIEPSDRFLLVEAARGRELTNARVRRLLEVDTGEARQALQRLRDAGFLEQRGERGGAHYVLIESLRPPAGLRLSARELDDLVVGLTTGGPITNAQVRAATGLSRSEALRVLDRLTNSGRLLRVGERRGSRYVRPIDQS